MNLSLIAVIIVAAVLVFFVIRGWVKGLLRMLFGMISLLLIAVVSVLLMNPIGKLLNEKTFVGPKVKEKVESFVDEKIQSNFVADKKDEFIESLPLPEFIKSRIKDGEALDDYSGMDENSFKSYIGERLANIIIKAITFIILFIILFIITRILFRISRKVNKVPVIGLVNRFTGAVLGLAQALIIIWCACFIVMALAGTEFGVSCMDTINGSKFLSLLYNNNLLGLLVGKALAAL